MVKYVYIICAFRIFILYKYLYLYSLDCLQCPWTDHGPVLEDRPGRLTGVISLLTVIDELIQVMSHFWSCDKVTSEICLFHEQDFVLTRWGCSFLLVSIWSRAPLYSKPEKWKWFTAFCCMDFSVFLECM